MTDFQHSLPQGREFLFCGLSGMPECILSWQDEIEVPNKSIGYSEIDGMVTLYGGDKSVVVVESSGIIDTKKILLSKLDTLKNLGIGVEISCITEVICENIDEVLLRFALLGYTPSHVYNDNKKVCVCSTFGEVESKLDELIILRHLIMKHGEKVSFLPISDGGCGFGLDIKLYGDRELCSQFLAGIILHSPECTIFTNSSHPSYVRLNSSGCAHYVSYGNIDGATHRVEFCRDYIRVRIEYMDNTGNPYLITSAILESGIMGVSYKATLPDEVQEFTPAVSANLVRLPMSLREALELATGSGFINRVIGEGFSHIFYLKKQDECKDSCGIKGEVEYAHYYSRLIKKG